MLVLGEIFTTMSTQGATLVGALGLLKFCRGKCNRFKALTLGAKLGDRHYYTRVDLGDPRNEEINGASYMRYSDPSSLRARHTSAPFKMEHMNSHRNALLAAVIDNFEVLTWKFLTTLHKLFFFTLANVAYVKK